MDVSTTITNGVEPGTVHDYAGSAAPNGYLLCDGTAVSRATYARLFERIGTAWGTGDGLTTFNLPNLCGRTTIGSGTGSSLTARTLGQSGGEETHILTSNEMPSHTHTQNAHNHGVNDPGHSHTTAITIAAITGNGGSPSVYGGGSTSTSSAVTNVSIQNATATNQNTGGGAAHNNMQPYAVLNKIIKF